MILSTNRWSNGENESGIGTVTKVLYRLWTKELARIVDISRVCN